MGSYGVGVSRQRRCGRQERHVAAVADGDGDIADEAVAADAFNGGARKHRSECGVVQGGESGEGRRDKVGAMGEFLFAAGGGEFVPGADGEAVVATIDTVAERLAEGMRDRAFAFDRQIGDAAPRIELVGGGQGICGAGGQAGCAAAAMIRVRRVGRQVQGGEDFAEEKPGTMGAGDEVGVFALPAQTRLLG